MTSSMPWKRAPSCATGPHGGIQLLYCLCLEGIRQLGYERRNKRLVQNSEYPCLVNRTWRAARQPHPGPRGFVHPMDASCGLAAGPKVEFLDRITGELRRQRTTSERKRLGADPDRFWVSRVNCSFGSCDRTVLPIMKPDGTTAGLRGQSLCHLAQFFG